MTKVIFRKHPKDLEVRLGEDLVLSAKTLSRSGSVVLWEADTGNGWDYVGKGKVLVIKEVSKENEGSYRCVVNGVCSRISSVTVDDSIGALEEIFECTGEDATPEVVTKAIAYVIDNMPESLKGSYEEGEEVYEEDS